MIEVDGSVGEGGGQLLRYSIALAALLQRSVRVYNIRAKRSNPGLRPQHLNAVRLISSLVGAAVKGLHVGSMEVVMEPRRRPRSGALRVDIGTAGSISLLLQAVLPVLLAADGRVRLTVIGGTNVKWSPPIQYLQYILLPMLRRFGVRAEVRLLKMGFYPRGGGGVEVEAFPSYPLKPVKFRRFREIRAISGISYSANLPVHVAERQARAALEVLRSRGFGEYVSEIEVDTKTPAVGRGSGVVLWAETDEGVVGGDALGERGKRAEVVGREAAQKLVEVLRTGAPVDPHALDNLVIYMSLAEGRSVAYSSRLTSHARTAIWLCRLITGARFRVVEDKLVMVEAEGVGYRPTESLARA